MSTFVPLVGGAQAEILYLLDGKSIENRLWFVIDTPPADTLALQGLADGLATWHDANIMPVLSSDIARFSVFVREWETDHTTADAFNGSFISGGVADESHSANVAVAVYFRASTVGRFRRPNLNYIPGIPVGSVDLNTPSIGLRTALFDAYVALIDDAPFFYPSNRWRWVLTSQVSGNVPRSEQYALRSIGPVRPDKIRLAQRRKRLP